MDLLWSSLADGSPSSPAFNTPLFALLDQDCPPPPQLEATLNTIGAAATRELNTPPPFESPQEVSFLSLLPPDAWGREASAEVPPAPSSSAATESAPAPRRTISASNACNTWTQPPDASRPTVSSTPPAPSTSAAAESAPASVESAAAPAKGLRCVACKKPMAEKRCLVAHVRELRRLIRRWLPAL